MSLLFVRSLCFLPLLRFGEDLTAGSSIPPIDAFVWRPLGGGEMDLDRVFQYFEVWKTRFSINGKIFGGDNDLTNDGRIYLLDKIFSLKGKRVLELGALEGGHSLMLSRLGAREVISVEGRLENFVKCCCIKDLFELHNVHFVLGDVNDVTLEGYGTFDIIVAIGILYHLSDPARVLRNLSRMTTRLFIWTHCSDESYPDGPVRTVCSDGSSYQGKTYVEGGPREPLSGLEPFSFWPFEEDLCGMIGDIGFSPKILDKGSLGEHRAKHCTIIATKE